MNPDVQQQYDDAMFDFSMGDYEAAIAKFEAILAKDPDEFDARLSLGMAHYRRQDYDRAIEEGHKAERLRPQEQLVHTNLSLFYMKKGDRKTAEHHGLQARIASWRGNMDEPKPGAAQAADGLQLAQEPPAPAKLPDQMPDMPWKKNKPVGGS